MEAFRLGDIELGAPLVPPSRAPGEPIVRNTRAATARGVMALNRGGRGGKRGGMRGNGKASK